MPLPKYPRNKKKLSDTETSRLFSCKKNVKATTSARKIMVAVFWDRKGLSLVNFLQKEKQLTLIVKLEL